MSEMNRIGQVDSETTGLKESDKVSNISADTDVVLRSSDGVRFYIRSSDLSRYSEGFPDSETAQARGEDDVVQLEEANEVLILLLRFARKQVPPDLSLVTPKLVLGLADAAEKYQVHQAEAICKYEISKRLHTPSTLSREEKLRILQYSFANGYKDIADQVAPTTLTFSVNFVQAAVSANALSAWIRYREERLRLIKHVLSRPHDRGFMIVHKGGHVVLPDCAWYEFQSSLTNRLWAFDELDVAKLVQDCIGCVESCRYCYRSAQKLGDEVQAIEDWNALFSQFM